MASLFWIGIALMMLSLVFLWIPISWTEEESTHMNGILFGVIGSGMMIVARKKRGRHPVQGKGGA